MGKVGRRIAIGVGVTVGLAGAALAGFLGATPYTPPPADLHVARTAEQVERGRYIAEHVAHCTTCHSDVDRTRFSGPVVPGTIGRGGQGFGAAEGLPFEAWSANITPAALGEWTDGELARALTVGVDREGDALVPIMRYENYRHLCGEDVEAVVAWMRSLEPIENDVPDPQVDFPLTLLLRTVPDAAEPWACPDASSSREERGRYLVRIAGCADCHTRREGIEVVGEPFAGGNEMRMPNGAIHRTANLTPDRETGLGLWTEEGFVNRFRAHRGEQAMVGEDGRSSPMPWSAYAGMSDEDLAAIYAFLRTQEPVHNVVEQYTPPPSHVASR
ncbi:hypothetical protein [Sandaracinus amylolyticus]|uniref:hypothetical protein n=1 Tax=Sandaracinus amylolyticus TaxID=927083 RepID=UPI001F37FB5C|nr:hypothetical protein [Sandaracinus amylolyticus]UJR85629.1 Hypothetical protein I5071_77090 [Sandaracinus amylolyticus]